ncbi:hypothetical protein CARUB_v10010838mg [Capsella rubella]|uniref:RING-type E3 ubiquitin transferase n=1 Tax=Capsella rubella TaxID=81985 RepID=R0GSF8_9BRAS|nr:RING finger protein 148 [Capsella rubella]EOA38721.1 hypothetical protein CARUB_v10010838mg [Capsella rubella]
MEVEITFAGEINLKPKSEDAGKLKICISVSGTSIDRETPNFVLSYDDFESVVSSYPSDLKELKGWLDLAGLTHQYVDDATRKLTECIYNSLMSMVFSPVCATLVNIHCKIIPSPPQAHTNNIRLMIPASKLSVDRLARRIFKNDKKMKTSSNSDDNKCSICMKGFGKDEIVVTLPCGHEFDDTCIVKWFLINHACPLCRFELPCQE